MPNTLHHTERPRLLGGVCTSGCMRDFKRISAVLVRRRHNERHGHGCGHQVTEALSLGLALSLHISWPLWGHDAGSVIAVTARVHDARVMNQFTCVMPFSGL